MSKDRLNRMLKGHWVGDKGGYIRFKYYGDFNDMKYLINHCKDDLIYIGNSNKDGSPVFVYYFDDIDTDTIKDFKSLNILLRKIKLKHYSKQELTIKEESLLSFFKFFMDAYDNYYIKGLSDYEINKVSYNTN